MNNRKLAVVYQVIFHYRIPFYKRLFEDPELEARLFFGKGVKGTKLKNSPNTLINTEQLNTLTMPFSVEGQKSRFSFFPFLFFRLIRYNPDVLLVEGASSIVNFISAFFYAKIFGKKIIMWSLGKVKGKAVSRPRKLLDNLIRKFEIKSDAIFAYSSVAKEYFIMRGVKRNKIFVGVNVIDTNQKLKEIALIKKEVKKLEGFRILFVGSIIRVKNLEILIKAFALLQNSVDDVYVDIIGDGGLYFDEIKNIATDNNIKNVNFHGRIIEGLSEYYLRSDVFVLPGLGGLAISEAMIYGLPVICTYADGTEIDLVKNGVGVFIEDMTTENLFNKLNYYYHHRDELKDMGKAAQQLVQTKYSFDNYYSNFVNCLNSCLNNPE